MKFPKFCATSIGLLASSLILAQEQDTSAPESPGSQEMTITQNGAQPTTRGPSKYFTGTAWIEMLTQPQEPSRVSTAYVTFEPGARTAWHTHPLGQTLVVTQGVGWIQQEGGEKQEIQPGDVIWTPPGVKHWHGATSENQMTHMAIQEQLDGKAVKWMEKVADDQYQQ